MKSVLLSIQPKWCEKIASGEKTVEIRKTRPKIYPPFKCYIYETKSKTDTPFMDEDGHIDFHGRGQVIGEFICDDIRWHGDSAYIVREDCIKALEGSCLTEDEFYSYMNYPPLNPYQDLKEAIKKYEFYGWHIFDLVIYDKPKGLSEFATKQIKNTISVENNIEGIVNYPKKEMIFKKLTKPPQSWCYVEELES